MDEEHEEDVHCVTDEKYSTVCELAKNGRNKELKKFLSKTLHQSNRKIGLATFAPDPKSLNHVVRCLSPLSYSAIGGNLDAMNLFLTTYRHAVTINPGTERYKENLEYKPPIYSS